MRIVSVDKESIAEEIGILANDQLISINGHKIEDKLDYQFYAADEELQLVIKRDNDLIDFSVERDYEDDLGLNLEAMKFRICGNNCVFCFVYQNPDGMRPALYIKDEDYRLSFLYGNYTTLTNATQKHLNKIVEQHLSPQYVSVHATDHDVRKLLLGIKFDDHLLDKIQFLTDNNIDIHGQIVLCPEINDGDILHNTITDLLKYFPSFKSLAIVPLGLTKYRDGLMKLRAPDAEYSKRFIQEIDSIRDRLIKSKQDPFVYLADEWYINADIPMPETDYYFENYQIENGVGLCREFINSIEEQSAEFPVGFETKKRITLVTAKSAGTIINQFLIPKLNAIENLEINLNILENNFYGNGITVSGLLTGEDIYQQIKDQDLGDLVLLPPRVLNPDEKFLDNWSVEDLKSNLNTDVLVYPHDMLTVLNRLQSTEVTA